MSFLHPEFLYFMLPPLFILFGLLLTQKEAQATFFSDEVMEKLRVSSNTLTLKARNGLFFLMGVLLVVALADPVIKEGTIEVKAKSSDIMIALDISDSMLATDVYPNRLEMAKQKALELLHTAKKDRIGVIAFAKNSYLVSPLSFDHSVVSFLLSSLNTKSITEKGTSFATMLDVVKNSLKSDGKKYLLILSDGGDSDDFKNEIALAKQNGIVVFVLGIGTPKGSPIKKEDGTFITKDSKIIISKLNENIASLATKTGGVYIKNTTSNEDIKAMLGEIERISEKKELKSREIERYIPLFYYPLGLAMILLLIATSSLGKRTAMQVPSVFILFVLLALNPHAEAGVLDFMKLDEAKKAYEQKDFAKSAKLYSEYAKQSKNSQSFYNAGNSLYKQGKYKEAIDAYSKTTFQDTNERAANFANMGNSHAKLQKKEELEKALKNYEESLKLKEDKDVRENYETVKKLLEQQKQKNKNDKKNNDKNNKNENKDKKSSNKDEDKKNNQDDKKQDSSDSKGNKQNQDDKKSQDKNQNDKQDQKQDENRNKPDKPKNKSEKKSSDENNQTKQQNKSASDLKQLDKKEKETQKDNSSSASNVQELKPQQMSEAEEKKWLKELNMNQSSFMYMLGKEKINEDKSNEIPW